MSHGAHDAARHVRISTDDSIAEDDVDVDQAKEKAVNFQNELREKFATLATAVTPGDSERARKWWELMSDALLLHLDAVDHANHWDLPNPSIPTEIVGRLAYVSASLGGGTAPPIVKDVLKSGRVKMTPAEQSHVAIAVAYRKACETGGLPIFGTNIEVADNSPIKSLVEWFGVDRRTVQAWCRTIAPAKIDMSVTDKWLTEQAQLHGKAYQAGGRSQTAIRTRSAKHPKG